MACVHAQAEPSMPNHFSKDLFSIKHKVTTLETYKSIHPTTDLQSDFIRLTNLFLILLYVKWTKSICLHRGEHSKFLDMPQ